MTKVIRLTPHIYLIGSGEIGLSEEHDCHVYLIDAGPSWWMVDAGAGIGPETLVANIAELSSDDHPISHLFLTHCHPDHAGGAAYIQGRFSLRLVAGNLTSERLSRGSESDLALDIARAEGIYPANYVFTPPTFLNACPDGSHIVVGDTIITILDTPGHSADSVCYEVVLPEGNALFCGDTLFANGLLPLLNTFDSDLAAYRQTIQILLHLKLDILCPGHGLFVLQRAQDIINQMDTKLSRSLYIPPIISP